MMPYTDLLFFNSIRQECRKFHRLRYDDVLYGMMPPVAILFHHDFNNNKTDDA